MSYVIDIENKTAIVTGAAGGIGSEIVRGFLENGADVFMLDICEKANNEAAEMLSKAFPERRIFTFCVDMTDEVQVDKAIEYIKSQTDRVDILVNNAGTATKVYSVNETPQQWNKVIGVNLSAQFFFTQKIAKAFMIPAKHGKIINMASLSAYLGIPGSVSYSASKGALLQMTRSLAGEWARFNIQVNCVCPGFVETALIADNTANERWTEYMCSRIPMKRLAKPQDVVGSVLFLSSGLADYITGTSIIVDGGYSA